MSYLNLAVVLFHQFLNYQIHFLSWFDLQKDLLKEQIQSLISDRIAPLSDGLPLSPLPIFFSPETRCRQPLLIHFDSPFTPSSGNSSNFYKDPSYPMISLSFHNILKRAIHFPLSPVRSSSNLKARVVVVVFFLIPSLSVFLESLKKNELKNK